MKTKILGILTVVTLVLTSCQQTSNEKQTTGKLTATEAKQIAIDTYKYGLMQAIFYGTRYNYTQKEESHLYTGLNRWFLVNDGKPITADNKVVVTPNATVGYGFCYLDLQKEPMVIEMPEIDDRYFSVQFMDQYGIFYMLRGNQFNGTKAGRYLLVGPDYKGEIPSGFVAVDIIQAPSNAAAGMLRIARLNPTNEADNKRVSKLFSESTITPYSQWKANGNKGVKRKNKDKIKANYATFQRMSEIGVAQVDEQNGEDFFNYMGLVLNDPGLTLMNDSYKENAMLERMTKINLGKGLDFEMSDFEPEIQNALKEGFKEGFKQIRASSETMLVAMNDWRVVKNSGDFDTNYMARAWMADFGYLGPDKNISHGAAMLFTSHDGELLTGEKKYTITFDTKDFPPVDQWWSIPIYDKDGYFVANELNRYTINNYMLNQLHVDNNGKITIYIQNEKPTDPLKVQNWLPAPNGDFRLTPRFYGPEQPLIDGRYNMPNVILEK